MINMQSAFLISSKYYSEKQAGIMFFVFGMSQFLFQTPAGYIMDYSDRKVALLAGAALTTTALTVLTALTAKEYGENIVWMVILKFIQGGVTALIPPGLNSITQGIVGSTGMTHQVADNEMKNHFGTAIIVLSGSLIAFYTYPNIGLLFIVSPIACAGVIFFLMRISPDDIDHDAARGLKSDADANATDYKLASDSHPTPDNKPSFNWASSQSVDSRQEAKPTNPLELLKNKTLLVFTVICFLFHMSNGTVLPLVMQTLAIGGDKPRVGFLLSGMCNVLSGIKNSIEAGGNAVPLALDIVILSTQILDGVGAGVFGTMYILVTSDIAAGTGRFSLTLGVTSAAMSIGGTVSGYLGQALAQDLGYQTAFIMLCVLSLVPALSYAILMPETLVIEDGNHSVKDTEVKKMEPIAENEDRQVV